MDVDDVLELETSGDKQFKRAVMKPLPRRRGQATAGHSAAGESHKAENHSRRRKFTADLLSSHPNGLQFLSQFPPTAEDFNAVEYRLLCRLASMFVNGDGTPDLDTIQMVWGQVVAYVSSNPASSFNNAVRLKGKDDLKKRLGAKATLVKALDLKVFKPRFGNLKKVAMTAFDETAAGSSGPAKGPARKSKKAKISNDATQQVATVAAAAAAAAVTEGPEHVEVEEEKIEAAAAFLVNAALGGAVALDDSSGATDAVLLTREDCGAFQRGIRDGATGRHCACRGSRCGFNTEHLDCG